MVRDSFVIVQDIGQDKALFDGAFTSLQTLRMIHPDRFDDQVDDLLQGLYLFCQFHIHGFIGFRCQIGDLQDGAVQRLQFGKGSR